MKKASSIWHPYCRRCPVFSFFLSQPHWPRREACPILNVPFYTSGHNSQTYRPCKWYAESVRSACEFGLAFTAAVKPRLRPALAFVVFIVFDYADQGPYSQTWSFSPGISLIYIDYAIW